MRQGALSSVSLTLVVGVEISPCAWHGRYQVFMLLSLMSTGCRSRRERRVVRFTFVIDLEGMGIGHRKCIPHIKEFVGGDFTRVVPNGCSTGNAHFVRSGKVFAHLFALCCRMGVLSSRQQATTFLIAGLDPFATSAKFAARYDRSALPSDIGGELTTGIGGHCCLGVAQPILCDEDAVWEKYLSLLSS